MTERTDEMLWEKIKKRVIDSNTEGTSAGKWSARKAQLSVRLYKKAGGRYRGEKSSSNSLVKWGQQKWRTKSGKKSSIHAKRTTIFQAASGYRFKNKTIQTLSFSKLFIVSKKKCPKN